EAMICDLEGDRIHRSTPLEQKPAEAIDLEVPIGRHDRRGAVLADHRRAGTPSARCEVVTAEDRCARDAGGEHDRPPRDRPAGAATRGRIGRQSLATTAGTHPHRHHLEGSLAIGMTEVLAMQAMESTDPARAERYAQLVSLSGIAHIEGGFEGH